MPTEINRMNRLLLSVFVLLVTVNQPRLGLAQDSDADHSLPIGIAISKPANGIAIELSDGRWMTSYKQTIRNGAVTFEMVPIPGGTFMLGSPESEEGRSQDEGPQIEIQVPPFWIGRTEVTWNEFQVYQLAYTKFKEQNKQQNLAFEQLEADAVSAPTPVYEASMVYAFGKGNQPAISMSQYGAMQYTKWLSLTTGTQYRLPSEAEWEYACRGGAQTRFSFGDEQSKLGEYAHFLPPDHAENVERVGTREVGTKQPNSFGLYDMHGNVAEWVMDQYFENACELKAKEPLADRYRPLFGDNAYQKVLRGGGWLDGPTKLRAATRFVGSEDLWELDADVPMSPHWLASGNAHGIGFRIARSLHDLQESEIAKYWNAQDELRNDMKFRLMEGRGAIGKPVLERSSVAR
jgi:formylglycine-generating enzyme